MHVALQARSEYDSAKRQLDTLTGQLAEIAALSASAEASMAAGITQLTTVLASIGVTAPIDMATVDVEQIFSSPSAAAISSLENATLAKELDVMKLHEAVGLQEVAKAKLDASLASLQDAITEQSGNILHTKSSRDSAAEFVDFVAGEIQSNEPALNVTVASIAELSQQAADTKTELSEFTRREMELRQELLSIERDKKRWSAYAEDLEAIDKAKKTSSQGNSKGSFVA
jgi:chromosome segregation ATPase